MSDFPQLARELAEVGRWIGAKGWAPATSGNYSAKVADGTIAITVSGVDKAALTEQGIMQITAAAAPLQPDKKSSAETLLHTTLYQAYTDIGCVLHTHSWQSVVLSRFLAKQKQTQLTVAGYEIIKAFKGYHTHEQHAVVPIVANNQDIAVLSQVVLERLQNISLPIGYIIEGHGAYSWGKTVQDAKKNIEALEFIIQCEWEGLC